jgi:shikimate dehydrogenase
VAGVIGDPVRHSLSPVLHNAAFSALDLDWVYVAFDVPSAGVPEAIAGMRALGIDGLSVTMPHKATVAALVDRLSPTAACLGVVNTVVRQGVELVGDSTDGDGFIASLRSDEGWDPDGRRCLLLGTGGAARSVALALGQAGAQEVMVVGRRLEMAQAVAALAGPVGKVGTVGDADRAELIINATPVGMAGVKSLAPGDELPFGLDGRTLGSGQLVVDLIYAPLVTPLLASAREVGAQAVNGLGMLIHQAGLQFRLWTGEDPPLEAMSVAAMSMLAHPSQRA